MGNQLTAKELIHEILVYNPHMDKDILNKFTIQSLMALLETVKQMARKSRT